MTILGLMIIYEILSFFSFKIFLILVSQPSDSSGDGGLTLGLCETG